MDPLQVALQRYSTTKDRWQLIHSERPLEECLILAGALEQSGDWQRVGIDATLAPHGYGNVLVVPKAGPEHFGSAGGRDG